MYYKTVLGSNYVTIDRLIKNFFLSRVNENIRIVLQSFNPFNLTSFIHGIRSQIEINALLNKFINDEEYLMKFILLNENREKVKELDTTININTLINKMDKQLIDYTKLYGELSLLLHPNPSTVSFYSQAEKTKASQGTTMAQPKLSYYFDEIIVPSKSVDKWFDNYTWQFLTLIEHFLILYNKYPNNFYVDDNESEQHLNMTYVQLVSENEKEILHAVNKAVKNGTDIQKATQEVIDKILNRKK